jgi:hypothetical protein
MNNNKVYEDKDIYLALLIIKNNSFSIHMHKAFKELNIDHVIKDKLIQIGLVKHQGVEGTGTFHYITDQGMLWIKEYEKNKLLMFIKKLSVGFGFIASLYYLLEIIKFFMCLSK